MSDLRWMTPRDDSWRAKKADGYFAVSEHVRSSEFESFYIEALWASPVKIGTTGSLSEAKAICDRHRAEQPVPTEGT